MSEIKIELKGEAKELYERLLGIVHCKDCKYWDDWQAHTYCGRFDEYDFMPSDGYCSYGERKDD